MSSVGHYVFKDLKVRPSRNAAAKDSSAYLFPVPRLEFKRLLHLGIIAQECAENLEGCQVAAGLVVSFICIGGVCVRDVTETISLTPRAVCGWPEAPCAAWR
jgi:hypothetical protein